MSSFSGLGFGLSFVFGCIFLCLVAEIYYLLWHKKRTTNTETENHFTKNATELFHLSCWKNPNSVKTNTTQEITNSVRNNSDSNVQEQDLELGTTKDLMQNGFEEEGVEAELMRLHNLCGPPRFLGTITEETKEDLESDDGKSRGDRSRKGSRTRSLSDLIISLDTPRLSSSNLKTPHSLDSYNYYQKGFNPLFESSTEAELNRLRSSPPPKFKFLRDAEEKLIRRLIGETEKMGLKTGGSDKNSVVKVSQNSTMVKEEKNGSFIEVGVGKNEIREFHHQAKVLPLACSPTVTPLDNKSIVQLTP